MEAWMKKRVYFVLLTFIVIVVITAFFNTRTDDERYYGFYEYENYPENADFNGGVVTVDESMGLSAGTVIAEIPFQHIDAGTYILDTDHNNDNDFEAIVYDGDNEIASLHMPASETNTRCYFEAKKNMYNMHIVFIYNGEGSVTVKRSILYADGLFYTDTIFFAVLLILAACFVAYILIIKDIPGQPLKDRIYWAVLIAFVFLVSYPYYSPLWHMSADGAFHLARIEGIFNEICHGQFPVIMFTDALHGRGTIAALYPQLFLYIPAVFRVMGVSLDGAVRVFFIIINISTCGTAWYAAYRLTGNRYYSLLAMILYCLLPYRLLAMLQRSAYGEVQAFVFIPLVVAGLYDVILSDRDKWPILAIGISGVLQSHVISTMNILIVCALVGVISLSCIIKNKRYLQIIYAVVATVVLNLWYLIPFYTYLRSDVSINDQMMTQDFSDEAYYVSRLIQLFPKQGVHFYSMGLGILLLVFAAIFLHIGKRREDDIERFALISLLIGVFFVYMSLKAFPWLSLQKISAVDYLTKMVKFPARLGVISQPLLLFSSIQMMSLNRYKMPHRKYILAIAIGLTLFQGYFITDAFLEGQDGFIDSREMRFQPDVADQFSYDYVPSGYWEEDFPADIESQDVEISDYEHSYTHSSFSYTSDSESTVLLPILYYEGYKATADGRPLKITKGRSAALQLTLPAAQDVTRVNLDFDIGDKTLWNVLFIISIIGYLVLAIYVNRKSINKDCY